MVSAEVEQLLLCDVVTAELCFLLSRGFGCSFGVGIDDICCNVTKKFFVKIADPFQSLSILLCRVIKMCPSPLPQTTLGTYNRYHAKMLHRYLHTYTQSSSKTKLPPSSALPTTYRVCQVRGKWCDTQISASGMVRENTNTKLRYYTSSR